MHMATATSTKRSAAKDDVVTLSRREYNTLIKKAFPEEERLTPLLKRAYVKAMKEYREGKSISYEELRKRLGY